MVVLQTVVAAAVEGSTLIPQQVLIRVPRALPEAQDLTKEMEARYARSRFSINVSPSNRPRGSAKDGRESPGTLSAGHAFGDVR